MVPLVALAAVLAMMLAIGPALAQTAAQDQYQEGLGEEVSATGVLEQQGATTYQYGTHTITDDASGTTYALVSERVDLDLYAGERVTVYGTLVSGYENGQVEGGPPLVDVTRVEAARTDGYSVRGFITSISGVQILVEEDPEDPIVGGSGSAKGKFTLTDETRILRQQGEDVLPADQSDLQVGQPVEATYAGPVAESYPTMGAAGRIVILQEGPAEPPADSAPPGDGDTGSDGGGANRDPDTGLGILPDTGGTAGGATLPLLGVGALLILGGFLVRHLSR